LQVALFLKAQLLFKSVEKTALSVLFSIMEHYIYTSIAGLMIGRRLSMKRKRELALLLLALMLILAVTLIGILFILPGHFIINLPATPYKPSISNNTSTTVIGDQDLVLPEYGSGGSIIAIAACLAGVFVVFRKKKK
jgi:hypothetical protein